MAMASPRAPSAISSSAPVQSGEDFEEISLVDVVRVLHRRRLVLALSVVVALVAGGAVSVFMTPQFEAGGAVIPVSHPTIIRSWLESRQAAGFAVDEAGQALFPVLFPDAWDGASQAWRGAPPSQEMLALELMERVEVSQASTRDNSQVIRFAVTLPDAVLARDVAAAYVRSLDVLRPQLENITRAALFEKFYDGTNAQEAQRRAETAAREQTYYLVFDTPAVPDEPVKPRPVLYMALSLVLGVMGGVMLVFLLEWLSKYRAEFARVEPPPR